MNEFTSTEVIVSEDPKDVTINNEKTKGQRISTTLSDNLKNFLKSFAVFTLFTAYFIWATHYHIQQTGGGWYNFESTSCNGYGFLVIIYSLYAFFYSYVYVIRAKLSPACKSLSESTRLKLNNLAKQKPHFSNIKKNFEWIFYIIILAVVILYLILDTKDNRKRLIPISGLILFLIIGFICCNNKSRINWRTVIWGIILQFFFGLLTIRWEIGRNILECVGDKVNTLIGYAFKAAEFPFGEELVKNQAIFAFKSLSTVYFISFLVNILYYYGIMQKIVGGIGAFLQWIMDTSICESVNSAANIFLGMTEAPLLLSPYLKNLTDSEIHSIMTSGFATVAGSVMAGYISFGARPQDLITASIMSAPAALCFSKLMHPETEEVVMKKSNIDEVEIEYASVLDAASQGAANAVNLVHGIISGLIAFIAAVYFLNGVLGWLGVLVGFTDPVLTLEFLTGKLFIPISFVMGIPWEECESVGTLIGVKTMVNEFVAFQQMGEMIKENLLSERTRIITTYAICGFSNPASIGIMISGLGTMIPNKRDVITKLVIKAWFGGALVCFMTACIAGAVMPDNLA